MEKIINQFNDIVIDYQVIKEINEQDKYIFEVQIWFIDASKLVSRDILIFFEDNSMKRKYSYHWMKNDNSLLIRWDNVYHHKEIETYPNHKHIESDDNVQASPEITLFEVLTHIRKEIETQSCQKN